MIRYVNNVEYSLERNLFGVWILVIVRTQVSVREVISNEKK